MTFWLWFFIGVILGNLAWAFLHWMCLKWKRKGQDTHDR